MNARRLMSLLPFKNSAMALLLCVFLGPIGLLYASFWGGITMLVIGLVVVRSGFFFPILLWWMFCCIWGMAAVENYNKKIFKQVLEEDVVTS